MSMCFSGGLSSSAYDEDGYPNVCGGKTKTLPTSSVSVRMPSTPNPYNWKLIKHKEYKTMFTQWLIIELEYPDTHNYEGKKILVFRDISLSELLNQKFIDPHFLDNNKFFSLIARFEPTSDGWHMANVFVQCMILSG